MEKISPLFILQILLGICKLCVLQNISADLRSVSPGEIITLHCSISADYEISWFHQNSEQQMKLLVSAARRKLDKSFSRNDNVIDDHYDITENSSSVSLVIIGVNDTDLGLYYCGGRNTSSLLRFGKPIRITFNSETETTPGPAEDPNPNTESPAGSADPAPVRSLIITLMCVCSASVLINIIGVCVFCYRVQGSLYTLWRNTSTTNLADKEQHELQYASPVYNRDLTDTANENTESSPDTVIYAKVLRPGERSPT